MKPNQQLKNKLTDSHRTHPGSQKPFIKLKRKKSPQKDPTSGAPPRAFSISAPPQLGGSCAILSLSLPIPAPKSFMQLLRESFFFISPANSCGLKLLVAAPLTRRLRKHFSTNGYRIRGVVQAPLEIDYGETFRVLFFFLEERVFLFFFLFGRCILRIVWRIMHPLN